MASEPSGCGQEAATPTALELRRRRSQASMTMVVAGAVLAWVAFSGRTTAEDPAAADSPTVVEQALCEGNQGALQLPPGHPPIPGSLRLPPGHPPIGLGPGSPSPHRLPAGHPPIEPGMGQAPSFPPGFIFEI